MIHATVTRTVVLHQTYSRWAVTWRYGPPGIPARSSYRGDRGFLPTLSILLSTSVNVEPLHQVGSPSFTLSCYHPGQKCHNFANDLTF